MFSWEWQSYRIPFYMTSFHWRLKFTDRFFIHKKTPIAVLSNWCHRICFLTSISYKHYYKEQTQHWNSIALYIWWVTRDAGQWAWMYPVVILCKMTDSIISNFFSITSFLKSITFQNVKKTTKEETHSSRPGHKKIKLGKNKNY